MIVEEPVADALAAAVATLAARLRVGDPLDERTDVGTLIDEPAAELVERRVAAAVADGAVLLSGGERRGAQLVPPVLDRVDARHELVREETFGPAIPLLRVRDLDEAIAVANGTAYGLSAGVVSNDLAAVTRCIRELRCGTVNVDEVPGFRTEATPFGGVKASGLGVKEGVVEAMRGMTNVKLFSLPWPGRPTNGDGLVAIEEQSRDERVAAPPARGPSGRWRPHAAPPYATRRSMPIGH